MTPVPIDPPIPLPLCPHCDAELANVGWFNWATGPFIIMCVYCPDCGRSIHMQVAPNLVAPAESSRIAIPS